MTFKTRILCLDSSLRSRMTGKYLIPLKNRTHLYQILTTPVLFYHSVRHRLLRPFKNDRQVFNTVLQESLFPFLLILAPFVSSVDTLAKAKRLTHFYSVASLLEKWFACFPTSGDGLHFARFPFM